MDRLGIETSVCSGLEALLGEPIEGNRLLEQGAAPHGERFKGYLAFNPLYAKPLVAAFDAFFARDFFVGFKALCDYWKVPVDDPRFNPAYEYANRHRLPFLLHTWQGSYDSPAMLKDVVKRYPDAVFILGHSGGPDRGRREAEELAIENPNVYLEFCGSFTGTIPWEETIGRVGNDRVLFGTDAVLHDPVWELGRFVSIDLPAETLRPILGDNMRRLLAARQ